MGLSQEALGKTIGVTFQQIQKYERGVNRMGSSRLYDFSKALAVPPSYFFEGYDQGVKKMHAHAGMAEDASPAYEHELLANREMLEMMRAFNKIKDPSVRKQVADLIKSLAARHAA